MGAVLIASAPPAVKISELLVELGHEVPAVVALRAEAGRYGGDYPAGLHDVVPDADLLFVRSGGRGLGALLRAYAPDVALCVTFPALIPQDALDPDEDPLAAAAAARRVRARSGARPRCHRRGSCGLRRTWTRAP